MRLLIVSHVIHYWHGGRLLAYGPYAREIDVWADIFSEVVIAAPCRNQPAPGDCLPFERDNISICPQIEAGGDSLVKKIQLIAFIPRMLWDLSRAMRHADAIHVRCPGNLGLLGAVLAPRFSQRLVAKYAAQWRGGAKIPLSVKLQRAILRSRWWKGPVTVYGTWPGEPPHIIPFFTSLLTSEQLARARLAAVRERTGPGLHVLFTGRLSKAKNVDVLLDALAQVRREGYPISATIVGEGPERENLERQAERLAIAPLVRFTGGIPFDQVISYLEEADLLVLASETEGWPKSLAEAMAFGVIAVGSNVGFVPQMLEERGFTVPPRDPAALVAVFRTVAASPDRMRQMRLRAAAWSQQYSLELLKEAILRLLETWWRAPNLLAAKAPSTAKELPS
jgi:glycosyltransferase involved in cell wall biosynthesis